MAVAMAKNERIDVRASLADKSLLERAAKIKHLSLSSYIISTSLRQAQLDLAEQETILLSNRDRDAIMAALENPIEPNDALKGLFR